MVRTVKQPVLAEILPLIMAQLPNFILNFKTF